MLCLRARGAGGSGGRIDNAAATRLKRALLSIMAAMTDAALIDALTRAHTGAKLDAAAFAPPAAPAIVQAAVVRRLADPVAGWKIGYGPDGAPAAGALLRSTLLGSGETWRLQRDGDGVLVEIEIAFRLAADLPARDTIYRRDEVLAAVAQVLVGIEIIDSRFAGAPRPDFDFPLWLADRMGNSAYVAGAGVAPEAAPDLDARRCRIWRDGALVHDQPGGHPHRDPLLPLLAYANRPDDELGGLRAGQIVTTGSLNTPIRCAAPCRFEAEIDGLGRVALDLV